METYSARPDLLEEGVFGADAGVVQARRDAVGGADLAVLVLQDVGGRAVQDALAARRQRGGVVFAVWECRARRPRRRSGARPSSWTNG